MKKKNIIGLILILVISLILPYSCANRYYSSYQGKVTRGYKKPPENWKMPKSRYLEPEKKRLRKSH